MGLVSVILPTYNRAELLKRAIRSVLEQKYTDLECIIIDDASTDNTIHIMELFDDSRLIYLHHKNNLGTSAARNTGIAFAKGDLIAFLDDDDEWLPSKLEKQVPFIKSLPLEVGMIYCWINYYDDIGTLIKEHHPTYRGYIFPLVLDRQRIGGCPTLIVRREILKKVGGFDINLIRGNDGDFIRRVCLNYEVDFISEVLVKAHFNHGYKRISESDDLSIRSAIRGEIIKLIKFKNELSMYPNQTAHIYAKIAYNYNLLGDYKNCITFYRKAIKTSPISSNVYKKMLFSLGSNIIKLIHT